MLMPYINFILIDHLDIIFTFEKVKNKNYCCKI